MLENNGKVSPKRMKSLLIQFFYVNAKKYTSGQKKIPVNVYWKHEFYLV